MDVGVKPIRGMGLQMLGVIAAIALLFEIHSRRAKKPNQSQTPILKPGSIRRSTDELDQ
jgi:hypothetical protein